MTNLQFGTLFSVGIGASGVFPQLQPGLRVVLTIKSVAGDLPLRFNTISGVTGVLLNSLGATVTAVSEATTTHTAIVPGNGYLILDNDAGVAPLEGYVFVAGAQN